jgi:hypothetical protein
MNNSGQHMQHQKLSSVGDKSRTLSPVQISALNSAFLMETKEAPTSECALVPTVPDFSCGLERMSETVRPTNLALETMIPDSRAAYAPKPPMRFKRVVRNLQAKRAQARLLSVPDIKYQKASISEVDANVKNETYDAAYRVRHSDESSGGAFGATNIDIFAGNFLRRFSKF